MCTFIGYFKKDYQIFAANRDVLKSNRHKEIHSDKTCWYPIDPKSHGTWIGINNRGLFSCLLYSETHDPKIKGTKSRGELVKNSLLGSGIEDLKKLNYLKDFAPFQFFINMPYPVIYKWNGKKITEELASDMTILTSSSYGFEKTKKIFAEKHLHKKTNAGYLKKFMSLHLPGQSPEGNICMHGDIAETTSCTIIEIKKGRPKILHLTVHAGQSLLSKK